MKWIVADPVEVRAYLEGRRTQSRRVILRAGMDWELRELSNRTVLRWADRHGIERERSCQGVCATFESRGGRPEVRPPFEPGEILFVKERWKRGPKATGGGPVLQGRSILYQEGADPGVKGEWKPARTLPITCARIFLRIADIGVQRLQDITETDALEEGFLPGWKLAPDKEPASSAALAFRWHWDFVVCNQWEKRNLWGWHENPWVWVYHTERLAPEEALGTLEEAPAAT